MDDSCDGSHCICLVFILIICAQLPLLCPERHAWTTILPGIRKIIWRGIELGHILHIDKADPDLLKKMFGDHLLDQHPSLRRPLLKLEDVASVNNYCWP